MLRKWRMLVISSYTMFPESSNASKERRDLRNLEGVLHYWLIEAYKHFHLFQNKAELLYGH